MNRIITLSTIALSLIVGMISACQSTEEVTEIDLQKENVVDTSPSTENLVEIRLIDDIDESRGYCLDIAGGRGTDAPINKGLQAHTCYDYTGSLLEDQSFDASLIKQGEFKIPYFDVCMTASSIDVNSTVTLATCENLDTQKFSLEPNGNSILQAKPELCITASSTEKKEGRGATPVHVMRPLSLQPCSENNVAYQAWSIFRL